MGVQPPKPPCNNSGSVTLWQFCPFKLSQYYTLADSNNVALTCQKVAKLNMLQCDKKLSQSGEVIYQQSGNKLSQLAVRIHSMWKKCGISVLFSDWLIFCHKWKIKLQFCHLHFVTISFQFLQFGMDERSNGSENIAIYRQVEKTGKFVNFWRADQKSGRGTGGGGSTSTWKLNEMLVTVSLSLFSFSFQFFPQFSNVALFFLTLAFLPFSHCQWFFFLFFFRYFSSSQKCLFPESFTGSFRHTRLIFWC